MKSAGFGFAALLAALALFAALLVQRHELLLLIGALALPGVLRRRSGRLALLRRMRALAPVLAAVLVAALFSAALGGKLQAGAVSGVWSLLLLRVLTATLWLTWATHDLTAAQLEAALHAAGLPEAFIVLLFATRRFGTQLTATLHAAWSAGVLRGGLLSLAAFRHTLGAVAGVVLVRALDRSERVAVAGALRGACTQEDP